MTDLAESLQAALDEVGHPETERPSAAERFRVTTEAQADWCLRKIAGLDSREQAAHALANAEMVRVQTWLDEQCRQIAGTRSYFAGLLEEWHRQLLAEDPRRKTVKLPHGELAARRQPDRWEFTDEFVTWAMANAHEALRLRHEVDRQAAKELLTALGDGRAATEDGTIAAGVTVTPGEIRFMARAAVAEVTQ